MNFKSPGFTHLMREAFLLLVFAYIVLLGGFAGLVSFRVQALSAFLVLLIIGGWLIFKLIRKRDIPNTGIDWVFGLFLASQFIAVAFSEDARRSLPHAILWLVYVLIFYFALDLLRRDWSQVAWFRCILIIGAVLLIFAALNLGMLYLQWKQLAAGLEFFPSFQQRLSTVVGDPNLLAAIVNLLLPVALATLLLSQSKLVRIALVIYVILSMVILYFTDSRGGLLGFAASVGVFILLWMFLVSEPAKKLVRHWARWFWQRKFLVLTGAVLVVAVLGFFAWRFISFQGSTTHAPALEARDIYWQAATNALKSDPLTGAGPGMFPIYLMKIWSTPPARPYLHAHSFPFQVAAESGLLGLAATTILVFVIIRQAWRLWKPLDYQARGRWAAAVAAIAGVSAHSLVDDFSPFPAAGATVFIFLAIILTPRPAEEKVSELSPWWLLAPGLAAAAFSIYCLNAYFHADRAVTMGSQGDWEQAAREMQIAAQGDPGLAWYWLQTGYALGRAAETNPALIGNGITAYEQGIEIEPEYALSHANLGVLLWAGGFKEQALHQMRIATSLAPESWLLLLNEGAIEEILSLSTDAKSSYRLAVNFRPDLFGSNFWNQTNLRIEAKQITTETTVLDDPRSKAATLIEAARQKIENSDFDSARSLLKQAHELMDQNVSLYVTLGQLAFGQADLEEAEQYLQLALWIQATNNQAKVEGILLGAEISLAKGDTEEAIRRYDIAYRAIFADTSYGWGSSGWSPYAWFVFQRVAFPEDLLPQLERADVSVETATRLLKLADLYGEVGDLQKAAEVRLALQPYLP